MKREIIVICGPTAVGKTKYAIETALHIGGEVVSCDSMQLYKYMDIGSAKPTAEERSRVKHYLVDEIDPSEAFSAAKYQKLAKNAIEEIFAKGKTPVIAGGTGLYLNALLYDMDFSAPPGDSDFRDRLYKEAEDFGPLYLHQKLAEKDWGNPNIGGLLHQKYLLLARDLRGNTRTMSTKLTLSVFYSLKILIELQKKEVIV